MKTSGTILLSGCFLAASLVVPLVHAQDFSFTTIAGSNAAFYNPTGVAVDAIGNVYVADQKNNLIRKITPVGTNWIVSTIAGGAPGSLDGTNTGAQFFGPTGIAVDSATNLYVADQFNFTIRKITPSGTNWVVSTIVGQAGVFGADDGTNTGARFHNPTGVAVDNAGNIFVADEYNSAVRKLTPTGTNWVVSTIAGTNTGAMFSYPTDVAVDANHRVFVADQFNNTIRLITPVGDNWVVTTIAGQAISGFSNGVGTNALFYAPIGVAVDASENVYVTDEGNHAIRELVPSGTNWEVYTLGGGSLGSSNGTGTNASFDFPFGVAADGYGDVFVADSQNNAIRLGISTNSPAPTGSLEVMISPAGAVLAGAQWQLDGGPAFQTNDTVLSDLAPGNHAITFSNVAGFTTPAMQTVTVTAHQTSVATGNYAAAIANTGSLQVVISPPSAIDAGAQWQVDSNAWQTNEAVVAGLSIGSHTLAFTNVLGWTTPASQIVAVTNDQTTLATGIYLLQTGSLQVTILPFGAVDAGAQWQVDSNAWQTNEAIVAGLPIGSHTLSFTNILGWTTPSSQIVIITNNQTTLAAGTYAAQTGSLQVTILPSAAVATGAQWQVDNDIWQTNGGILTGLPVGAHILSFTNISGWTTPSNQTVIVSNNQVTPATGTYVLQTGSLQVNIFPSTVVTAGAQWQVDGGPIQNNGVTISNLSPGNHTLSFTSVFKWTTPVTQTFVFTNGAAISATGVYTPFAASSDGLVLLTNGDGTIQHARWPTNLVIGKKYTVTAVPKPGNVFFNWVGGTNLPYFPPKSSANYTFTMQSNLVLEASFATNIFLAAQGTYRGLFAPTNSARQQAASGSFSFNLASSGTVSGNLAWDGQMAPLSGKFDLSGAAELVSTRPHGEPALTTTLQIDFTNQSVSGTVSNGVFTGELDGDRDVFSKSHEATNFEGQYTLIIPGTNDPEIGPFGVSYGTLKVNSLGAVTLAGTLADGTAISQSSAVSKDGYWPLYVNLYGGKGSLWGWCCFTNQTIGASPVLSWINETNSARTGMYRSGFTNEQTALIGESYVSTFTLPANLTGNLAGGNLSTPVTITNLSENTNKLILKINKTTGVISGSFANPTDPKETVKVNGVILAGQTNATGYFPGTNQSGSFTLDPP
jgi:hypothetical protein